jgi:hypothetical protein
MALGRFDVTVGYENLPVAFERVYKVIDTDFVKSISPERVFNGNATFF